MVILWYSGVQRIMGSRKSSLVLMYIIAAYKHPQPHKHTVLECVYMTVNVCFCLCVSMYVCMHAQDGPVGSFVYCRAQCQSQGPLSPQLCVNSKDHSAPDSSFYKQTSDITHTVMTHTLQLPHASYIQK